MLASSLLFRTLALKKDQKSVGGQRRSTTAAWGPAAMCGPQHRVTAPPRKLSPSAKAEDPISKADDHICDTRLICGPARAGTRQHLLKSKTAWSRQRRAKSSHRKETVKTNKSRRGPRPRFARHVYSHRFGSASLRAETTSREVNRQHQALMSGKYQDLVFTEQLPGVVIPKLGMSWGQGEVRDAPTLGPAYHMA